MWYAPLPLVQMNLPLVGLRRLTEPSQWVALAESPANSGLPPEESRSDQAAATSGSSRTKRLDWRRSSFSSDDDPPHLAQLGPTRLASRGLLSILSLSGRKSSWSSQGRGRWTGARVDHFDPEKWPSFVWFPAFLRDWERLGLNGEDLRALELEILKEPTRAR